MDPGQAGESFRGLALRHRGRTGLTQRQLAARLAVDRRTVQDWEVGVKYPTAERLQTLVRALLEAGGLTLGQEPSEARALWTAARRESPRMHTPFDEEWFARLLAAHVSPTSRQATDELDTAHAAEPETGTARGAQDWGEAPDTVRFVGRAEELALLRRWVLEERSRVVAVLGFGGIGKTIVAARLAQDVAPTFERVYWRSLRNAPPVTEWLAGAIGFLSDQTLVSPPFESDRRTLLLQLLRARRCLLVLDNAETLLEPRHHEIRYRADMDEYGRLLHAIGNASHQSCLVLTSREALPELGVLDDGVRELELHGLGSDDARVLLADRQLSGDEQAWARLVDRYGGNGLALKIVAETIQQVFDGDIAVFLADAIAQYGTVFGGIRRLLDVQVERLSPTEQDILRRLAVEREPISLTELTLNLPSGNGRGAVIEAIEALRRRSLVERGERSATFTVQSMVLEYVTDRLVEAGIDEIGNGRPVVLVEQPLVKALAKDYVRQMQERLIGTPIVRRLVAERGEAATEERLLALLERWRGRPGAEQRFGPGNVVNLLRLLRGDLRRVDLSRLTLRQAYLQGVDAQDASLAGSHLAGAVLAEAFAYPTAVALSADGALLAAGSPTGEVRLWRVADRTPLLTLVGHTGTVWGLAFSADARLVASGSADGTVRLWEVASGQLLASMNDHTGAVRGVALSADGRFIASAGWDGTVRLWEAVSGQAVAIFQSHTGAILSVALSGDTRLVASGGADGEVRIWDAESGQLLTTLHGHTGLVDGVGLNANGRLVASCGVDGTVRLWEVRSGQLLATQRGHSGAVWGLALSEDGRLVASGGMDETVRRWDAESGQLVATLQGHTGAIWDVALSGDGQLVASGGMDGTVKLWELPARQLSAVLQGHTGLVYAVALDGDGRWLASGGADGTVRLWETGSGQLLASLPGRTGGIWGATLSEDGRLLASGGVDGVVRLWDSSSGQLRAALQGHSGAVWDVALSGDGRLLASGGADGTVRLWHAGRGQLVASLTEHTGAVWGVALSHDGRVLASGGLDGTVRLWEASSGHLLTTLRGHSGAVWDVALSGDGQLVTSGGADGTVRLWQTRTGRPLATLPGNTGAIWSVALSEDGSVVAGGGVNGAVRIWDTGEGQLLGSLQKHTGAVWDVALSGDGRLLASGGDDGLIRLWEARTAACLRTMRSDRRYERLDITGLTGVTDAQRTAMLALGAFERVAPADEPGPDGAG